MIFLKLASMIGAFIMLGSFATSALPPGIYWDCFFPNGAFITYNSSGEVVDFEGTFNSFDDGIYYRFYVLGNKTQDPPPDIPGPVSREEIERFAFANVNPNRDLPCGDVNLFDAQIEGSYTYFIQQMPFNKCDLKF